MGKLTDLWDASGGLYPNNPLAQWTRQQVAKARGEKPPTEVSTSEIQKLIERIDILLKECKEVLRRTKGHLREVVQGEVGEYDLTEAAERQALKDALIEKGLTDEQITAIMLLMVEGEKEEIAYGNTSGAGSGGKET